MADPVDTPAPTGATLQVVYDPRTRQPVLVVNDAGYQLTPAVAQGIRDALRLCLLRSIRDAAALN